MTADSETVTSSVLELSDSSIWLALAPFVLLGIAFAGYCLYDLSRTEVRYLPKWVWALVCVMSIPAGGIIYLLIGRRHDGAN